MAVAVSTLGQRSGTGTGTGSFPDRERTVRALLYKLGLADAAEVGQCRRSATECVT